MRYYEIIESAADTAAKAANQRLKANKKLDDARRKRTRAAQKHQDQVRSANDAEREAKAKLSAPS